MNAYGWICLATVCIVHTGINYCLYFSSLKDMSGPKVALLSYIDPLISVLLSFLILGEKITMLQIIGAILLLGSMLLNEVLPNKTKEL
jgi:drug/metabolite transporter (DMT)-like permease